MLDDVTIVPGSTANEGYYKTFTSEQLSWLRQDIEALPSGITQIVVCTHCPVLSASGSAYNIDAKSGETLFDILKNYEVVCLTGHNHYDKTIKGVRNGNNVFEYIHPSLAGTAWFTTLADDGTPRSAGIYRINGSGITRSLYPFDNPESKTYTIYNKAVNENTGTKQTSLDDEKGTKEAILVNFPLAYTCEFSESTGGQGTTENGTIYDLNFRDFYVNFNVPGKKLGNWEVPTAPGHIWRYIPANPSAVISIKAKDAYGRSISTEGGQFITTKIEH